MPIERPRPQQRRIDTGHADDDAQLTQMSEQMHLVTPDGSGWTLQVTRDAVQVSAIAVKHARRDFSAMAQRRGGEYDGWRAWL